MKLRTDLPFYYRIMIITKRFLLNIQTPFEVNFHLRCRSSPVPYMLHVSTELYLGHCEGGLPLIPRFYNMECIRIAEIEREIVNLSSRIFTSCLIYKNAHCGML